LKLGLGRVWRTVLPPGMCATERNVKEHNTVGRPLHESCQYQEPLCDKQIHQYAKIKKAF
jgi:hypothetical protein